MEGASRLEDKAWACNFLAVAHQRSGLFIEAQPGVFAFSHQNFREYLAATALIDRLDRDMLEIVLANAQDPWWEEVILLGAAHPKLSSPRRAFLLAEMLEAGHLVLAGRCAVDAGARLPAPLRRRIQKDLHARMIDASLAPTERYVAGEILDELGWLPDDLNTWVRCAGCADDGGDLMVARYPVTNAQFERFVVSGACHPLRRDRSAGDRVLRGGSWNNNQANARCSARNRNNPHNSNNTIGVRVVFHVFRASCRQCHGLIADAWPRQRKMA